MGDCCASIVYLSVDTESASQARPTKLKLNAINIECLFFSNNISRFIFQDAYFPPSIGWLQCRSIAGANHFISRMIHFTLKLIVL